ncbi:MAG: 4-(cytidine 5'-diphospho)-2-C-methyl-D-erythritol kinase [Collinsella sp.]
MTDRSLTLSAPAKINLYLGVHTERDDRGYHRVDSLMAAVGLSDTVTVTPAQALTVQTVPASDFPMQKNTAYRAAVAMAELYGREANICVTIEKRIPLCAGLGGPSTDAAAVIVALAELWGIDRTDPALDDIARGIGADVPFFLHASPAFYVGGGDVLATEYPALPATPVVLVKPREASVSTIEAYRRFDEAPVPADKPGAIASALRAGDAETAYALIHNNLGVISAQMESQIQTVLDWLRKQDGTVAVDVCGSGACSFAICDTAATAERLADAAQQNGWWACATELISNTVQIDAPKK